MTKIIVKCDITDEGDDSTDLDLIDLFVECDVFFREKTVINIILILPSRCFNILSPI